MAHSPTPEWRPEDIRELRDPKDMRALAHPTRLALIEVLTLHGPMTATEASGYVGESPSSCSFHLRTLARHGFVDDTGDGTGRQRPWRIRHLGTSVRTDQEGDPGTRTAALTLADLFLDRQVARFRNARSRQVPPEWRPNVTAHEMVSWLTPDEARQLTDEIMTIMDRYKNRITDPSKRPAGSRPVETVHLSFPTDFEQLDGADE